MCYDPPCEDKVERWIGASCTFQYPCRYSSKASLHSAPFLCAPANQFLTLCEIEEQHSRDPWQSDSFKQPYFKILLCWFIIVSPSMLCTIAPRVRKSIANELSFALGDNLKTMPSKIQREAHTQCSSLFLSLTFVFTSRWAPRWQRITICYGLSNHSTVILFLDPFIVSRKQFWGLYVIRVDGQLEAFEENGFLHFLLLNLENSCFHARFYTAFQHNRSCKEISFKATDGFQ